MTTSRRMFVVGAGTLAASGCRGEAPVPHDIRPAPPDPTPAPAPTSIEGSTMHTRPIPKSGDSSAESIPVIGLGTWSTFDVDASAPLQPVVDEFLAAGARVIDSSPMYGRAEQIAGELLANIDTKAFVATKVWTRGKARGIAEMERSIRLLGHVDLMQVHNLLDTEVHMPTLRAWKAEGRIRYIGVTHYQLGALDDLETWVRSGDVDFVQLPYSVRVREAEKRLLPAAADAGCAVLVMRPFEEGALFDAVRGKALPEVAAELGCTSWSQLFLKWILGNPAVTCPIPATAKVGHLRENLAAGVGVMPDEGQRRRIAAAIG